MMMRVFAGDDAGFCRWWWWAIADDDGAAPDLPGFIETNPPGL